MTEISDEIAETQPPLRDNSPAVSVDITLGQRYNDVSFDYDAFEKEAEEIGLNTEQQAELSISLTPATDTTSIQVVILRLNHTLMSECAI